MNVDVGMVALIAVGCFIIGIVWGYVGGKG
jgi:hypothetical protein